MEGQDGGRRLLEVAAGATAAIATAADDAFPAAIAAAAAMTVAPLFQYKVRCPSCSFNRQKPKPKKRSKGRGRGRRAKEPKNILKSCHGRFKFVRWSDLTGDVQIEALPTQPEIRFQAAFD